MSDGIRGVGELGDAHIRGILKAQFGELLDAAAYARAQHFESPNNRDVVALAAKLMRKVLGEIAQIPLETEDEAPTAASYALEQWLPVFSRQQDTLWDIVIDELALLPHGDHPSLLAPKKRRPGERDFKTALMKLSALKWNAYLNTHSGRKALDYQAEIALAFGASWETIEKWKSLQSEKILREHVENAGQGVGEGLCYPDYEPNLWLDGDRYRRQTGKKSISFEEFLRAIRKN